MITVRTRVHNLATRARRTWSELDYAQRRLFEIRTGVEASGSHPRRRHGGIEELERLYRAD
ncbi:MAG TPA: hypothetical protein VG371_17560 [Solirubrobacteraceae bacterium]|jgi:hypothetical protein|nr:hypothetical protein [Solirubrobacteraceae bacterium]